MNADRSPIKQAQGQGQTQGQPQGMKEENLQKIIKNQEIFIKELERKK
mgnify:CR=1 FL=1